MLGRVAMQPDDAVSGAHFTVHHLAVGGSVEPAGLEAEGADQARGS